MRFCEQCEYFQRAGVGNPGHCDALSEEVIKLSGMHGRVEVDGHTEASDCSFYEGPTWMESIGEMNGVRAGVDYPATMGRPCRP
ncbi:hypothetical protein [Desulfovibrio inopinatus]|uniref:hypothetical protein n=1 Tax=Desulfovibrio inopinatus TaxID=102109 RepID=UPI000550655B|nr:hypothetical protein [Desulfovibrio inopinatus]